MSNEDKTKLNSLAAKLNLQVAKELKNNGKKITQLGDDNKIKIF